MDDDRRPFPNNVEVLPPLGEENAQPVQANWIVATGGGAFPIAVDLFYLSAAFLRRISSDEEGHGIERKGPGHVICRVSPAARISLSVPNAADLIVSLYALLRQDEQTRIAVDRRIHELAGEPSSPGAL